MKGKKIGLRAKLLLAVFSPVVFLFLLEGLLRLTGSGHPTQFLLKKEFDGNTYYVANPYFTSPWFPGQNPRTPVPFGIPVEKPKDSLRVLILGASAAQGDPKPEFGFSRMLDRMLSGQFEGRKVEVYNLGITAINSHVVKEIAKECGKLEADYWIVYLGNNEVIGPFGPANPSFGSGGAMEKARFALLKSRTGQFLAKVLRGNKQQLHWKGMESYLKPVEWRSKELERVYKAFLENLESILQSGTGSGAEVLLCTVAANLRSCAPLNPDGKAPQAWESGEFVNARDWDTYRFRADSRINGGITNLAKTPKVHLLPAAKEFEQREPASPKPLFLDHVHFTLQGNNFLAALLGQQILELEEQPIHPPKKSPTLGYTDFDKQGILRIMKGRLSRPPFDNQASGGLSTEKLDGQIEALGITSPTQAQAIQAKYEEAIHLYPEDPTLRNLFATFLLSHNQSSQAKPHCMEAIRLAPWDANTHYNLALAHVGTNSQVSAKRSLKKALELSPNHSRAHTLLGNMLAKTDPDRALQHFNQSVQIEPDDSLALLQFANFLLAKGNKATGKEKEQAYALALRANQLANFQSKEMAGLLIRCAKQCGKEEEAKELLNPVNVQD